MLGRFAFVALLLATAAPAQNSKPMPLPLDPPIASARDIPYPGTMLLDVDATDTDRAIFRVRQTIPVAAPGPMTLLFPKWHPGKHAPRGEIEKLAGLTITANGKRIPWTRDLFEVYAFRIDVPRGAQTIEVAFQMLSATDEKQGRVVVTNEMMNLQWEMVSLYPAGYFTRNIPVRATVRYPEGWTAASGLPSKVSGGSYRYDTTDYETLVDSPVFAGRHFRSVDLGQNVRLNIVADAEKYLASTPAQIDAHKRLVDQSIKLFGTRHFDKYEFLLSLTKKMGGIGLEHHRSSENGVNPEYFTEWDKGPNRRGLLPHEFVHSWNGKHVRPAGMWVPDYSVPMRDDLLWVYEGQTQFWGTVLAARSGLFSKQETLDSLAVTAASLDNRPARGWRSLVDTTLDPVIAARKPKGWLSWQRSEDYYAEGMLVWMEVDSILRARSGGAKSMDDFAGAFFGRKDGDWGIVTYTFDDVVATLNGIVAHDWAALLTTRLTENAKGAPLAGFAAGGYRLVYRDEPTPFQKDQMRTAENNDLSYSLGLVIGKDRTATAVMWEGPAFAAGIDVGTEIVAVGGQAYSDDAIKAAVTAAKGGKAPIRLLVKNGDRFRDLAIDYHDGLRYPRFEKNGTGEGGLDRLLAAKP